MANYGYTCYALRFPGGWDYTCTRYAPHLIEVYAECCDGDWWRLFLVTEEGNDVFAPADELTVYAAAANVHGLPSSTADWERAIAMVKALPLLVELGVAQEEEPDPQGV